MQPLQQWWSRQARETRFAVVGGTVALIALIAIGGAMLLGGGDDGGAADDGGVVFNTPRAGAPSATHEAGPTTTAEPLPTEDPTLPTLKALKDFVEEYGDPPRANLGRLKIPRIGVNAPIGERVVAADLSLQYLNPYGPADVTWYNFSVDSRFGGDIGDDDNAIFAAHVDYAALVPFAQANYRGAGVFRDINLLNPGDIIEVQMHGKNVRYKVVWKHQVSEDEGDWGGIFSADVPEGDSITLITCSGDFNTVTREYDSRTVIRGTVVDG